MRDQATELRNLVLQSARQQSDAAGPQPRLIVLTGGKGGVGVTTIAVNLSVALAELGARVVLVDADLYRADVATMCGVAKEHSVSDVLAARRDIHEVLRQGPSKIQVAAGAWPPRQRAECSENGQLRLINQIKSLGKHADLVVLDIGCGPAEVARRFWRVADDVLLVTTPDAVAVMDCYATVKTLVGGNGAPRIGLVVNQAVDAEQAAEVHQRLDHSARRFLQLELGRAGWLPMEPRLPESARRAVPLAATGATLPWLAALGKLATSLLPAAAADDGAKCGASASGDAPTAAA